MWRHAAYATDLSPGFERPADYLRAEPFGWPGAGPALSADFQYFTAYSEGKPLSPDRPAEGHPLVEFGPVEPCPSLALTGSDRASENLGAAHCGHMASRGPAPTACLKVLQTCKSAGGCRTLGPHHCPGDCAGGFRPADHSQHHGGHADHRERHDLPWHLHLRSKCSWPRRYPVQPPVLIPQKLDISLIKCNMIYYYQ